ncbi:MAG: hypothetical protein AAF223_22850 [Bacteroidota bacterium]
MIKRYSSHTEIKRFVFLTEQEYILYFGQNYENSVQQANATDQPVIRARNGNGIISSIPTERANYLLEKYHKLLKKNPSLATPPQSTEGDAVVAS